MQIDRTTAVVDNDFINHLADSKISEKDLLSALNCIFSELELVAAIHPLVFSNEVLIEKVRVKLLFDGNIIQKAEFSDIFSDNSDEELYYYYLVQELYYSLTGEKLPASGKQIQLYWKRGKSMGEVHSLSMCLVCGCGLFLSDDGDAKRLRDYIKRKSIGSITVYDRTELIDKHLQEGKTQLPRATRKSLAHKRN